jgi:hypothetical protein
VLARAELRDPALAVWPQIGIKELGEQLNCSIESWLKIARAGSDRVVAYPIDLENEWKAA